MQRGKKNPKTGTKLKQKNLPVFQMNTMITPWMERKKKWEEKREGGRVQVICKHGIWQGMRVAGRKFTKALNLFSVGL